MGTRMMSTCMDPLFTDVTVRRPVLVLGVWRCSLERDGKGGSMNIMLVSVNAESSAVKWGKWLQLSVRRWHPCLRVWLSAQDQGTCLSRPGFNLQREKRGETDPSFLLRMPWDSPLVCRVQMSLNWVLGRLMEFCWLPTQCRDGECLGSFSGVDQMDCQRMGWESQVE